MIEGDFVQFYEPRRSSAGIGFRPDIDTSFCYVCNGFSYLSSQIKEHWVDIRLYKDFVPRHEKVYVSVWYGFQQRRVLEWAKKHPKNQFVLGGPLYKTNQIRYTKEPIPENVYFTSELAEDHFKIPIDLTKWKFTFPYRDYPLQYSYNIGSRCYWGKCSFCWPTCNRAEKDKRTDYTLDPLVDAPPGEVVFSIPAPTPKMLEDILPKLAVMKNNENKVFSIYLRAGAKELESLKKIRKRINFRKTTFCIGVEFPSDRMLKIMDKGVTLQEYINMINFIQKNDGNCVCYFITGWPEIEESDVKEAERFFNKIPLKHDCLRFIWGRMIKYDTVIPEKKINSNVPMVMVKTYKPALTDKYKIDCNQGYIDVLNKFNCIERIVDNPIRKLPVIDKENLYKKYVLPLEK